MTRVGVPPARSPVWVALGAALSGVSTYATLVTVGRALGAEAYGSFSVFWSAILIISFGLFLPVEQVISRRQAGRQADSALRSAGTRAGLVLAAVTAVIVVLGVELAPSSTEMSVATATAFGIAVFGFAFQFPARGILAGTHHMRDYAVVLGIDAVGRFVVIAALAFAGVQMVGPYAGAIAATALVAGITGLALSRSRDKSPAPPATGIAAESARLSVAMLCMQALVNSPMLIAGFLCDDPVTAGHLLAATTIARLSVFVAQSGQAFYVGRIAAASYRGHDATRHRLVKWVSLLIGGIAVATFVGMALAGPPLINAVYGDGYGVDRTECLLIGAGIAAYLVATVANDLSVALEQHRHAGTIWLVGTGVAVIPVLAIDDTILRSTLPLLVGTTVTALLTLRTLIGTRSPRMET
jgi:O-antigen/teichoic acid export membrane protein